MSNKVFQNVGNVRPGRSAFDLSYSKLLTCDMGQLIPVMHDEVVPGDIFKIQNSAVIRMMPLVAPVMHPIAVYCHYFFVPYRLLSDDTFDWEEFITGGVDGDDSQTLPVWNPTSTAVGSLWDYMGFPGITPSVDYLPLAFPRNAYNLIYNNYYIDRNVMTDVALDQDTILTRMWEKDYFTSALPWQQRGTPVALPISGTTTAEWPDSSVNSSPPTGIVSTGPRGIGPDYTIYTNNDAVGRTNFLGWLALNEVDLSNATTFDVSDLRLAFQIQKWMERNARSGSRYREFLGAHFDPSFVYLDQRLQVPEYIGGSKAPIIVSEVLQTSETNTSPQGNLAGHGITVSSEFVGSYHVKEYGIIMGIMSIMPVPMYNSQGFNRQWLRRTRYDFYFPEFANLSEQAIEQGELYATGVAAECQTPFGYQGRYDEMRYKPSLICGDMRGDFAHWHLAREFASAPALNGDFLKCVPDKRIFAVESEPGFMVQWGNLIKAIRPLPAQSVPGLIDHN